MACYQFIKLQVINATNDEVWDFMSSPKNLKRITPEHMGFDIISQNSDQKMYPGMIISYVVQPFFGYKTNWVTEITHVREKEFFVDEQRIGPYSLWHHQHILESIDKVTIMKDIITYQPPFGIFGVIANHLFIRRKLNQIFNYREKAIEVYFTEKSSSFMSVAE